MRGETSPTSLGGALAALVTLACGPVASHSDGVADGAPIALDPSEGVLAHYGPRDADDPGDVAAYTIEPGAEVVDCVYSKLHNETELYFDRYDVWSHPGTHHVILSAVTADVPDGERDDCEQRNRGSSLLAVVQGGIDGGVYRYPPADDRPPENAGLGTRLGPHQTIAYEVHAINSTEEPILRETWTAFYAKPKDEVTATVGQMAFNGGLGMHVPPHSTQIVSNRCVVTGAIGPIRVVDLFGHMHAHGARFSAWVARAGSTDPAARTLVYESYDWSALDLIRFDSVRKNPVVTYGGGQPGGYSGILTLAPGDRLDYECEMNNTESYPLVFAPKALTGEMCNMFGSYTPGTVWSCIGE